LRALATATTARSGIALILVGAALFALWQREQRPHLYDIGGVTMGSTWSARIVAPTSLDVVALQAQLEAQLQELDRQLSGYRDSAVLWQLNAAPVGEWRALPEHLAAVIRYGMQLHDASGGAFDLTVKPLVNLWGFGAAPVRTELPSDDEIAAARARLGNDRIEVSPDASRIRRNAEVSIDVDAIAPGHVADVLAAWLTTQGLPNHLVEIGGEVRAEGHRPDGSAWRIGIERPVTSEGDVKRTIAVTDRGVATSGDYRVFVELAGKRYSHTIDPATGRPVNHLLASVTIVAPNALIADGCATTVMVLGPERGMAWADARGLGVYMVVRADHGALSERYNTAFEALLEAH
jgi:thiamine biosynthesis lipoprotein